MTQADATELAMATLCDSEKKQRMLRSLYRRSGVQERRTCMPHQVAYSWADSGNGNGSSVATATGFGPSTAERMAFYEELAPPLATEACQEAITESGLQPEEVTHLVTVSCTGFSAPGVDVALIRHLGLRNTVQRVNVGFMGCHGAVNGLRVVQGLVSDPTARVLMCCVELCSIHYCLDWDPERLVGNALFADGAAALVCVGGDTSPIWQVKTTASCLLPDSTQDMSWRIGDHGYGMTLSPQVPQVILEHLKPFLSDLLADHGWTIDGIATWAIHPGGPRIVAAVEEALALTTEDTETSRGVLAELGNMSSPTILFILDRLRKANAPGPAVAIGFGPGLVAEVALLDRVPS